MAKTRQYTSEEARANVMRANVHTPQRLDGETMAEYRERRERSRREARESVSGVRIPFAPASPQRKERRAMVKAHGRRQALRILKGFQRAEAKAFRDIVA